MSTNTNDEPLKNQWRLKDWFPDLAPNTIAMMQSFHDLIIKNNKTVSLVNPKTLPVADALHFSDCILACQIVRDDAPKMNKIFDLGSGGGLPGVLFAILYPEVEVVLVDNDVRKIEFLKKAVTTLGLKNASVLHSSVENLPADSIQYAITRGIGNISKTILLARKPFAKGGILYHMKTEQWGLEITEIPTQLCSVWFPALVREYILPTTQIRFGIVKTTRN